MRIGIVGGTGFIGSALGREAARRGHQVIVFSRQPDKKIPWAAETRAVSASDPVIDVTGIDALVNLVGESVFGLWTKTKRQRIRDSRVILTNRIADALAQSAQRPAVFLSASGSGVYGNRGDEILTESSSRGTGFLADVCVEWEAAALRATQFGTRVVLLRTGVVLGANGGAWPMLKRVFSFCLGGRLGDGKQWMPWIHLDDEVGIILHAIENTGISGPVNLAAPDLATNAAFTSAVARTVKRPAICHAPAFALKLILGEFGSIVLDSQRVQPAAALAAGYVFKHSQIDEALKSLA